MIETTVALKLPIRRVLLGDPTVPPPEWLVGQHRRLNSSLRQASRSRHGANGLAAETAEPIDEADLARMEQKLRQQTEALERAAAQLREAANVLKQRWEQIVLPEMQEITVELAHAIASKLVLDRLAIGQFPIENIVQQVVERLTTDGPVVVKLHPTDLALFQTHAEQRLPKAMLGDNVTLQADPSLSRGDCQATAGEVSIIYELRRQIEELRHQLQP